MKKLLLVALLFPSLVIAQSYLEQFPLRQETKCFDFRYRIEPEKVTFIARFADSFIKHINRDFFKAEFDYPILVLVLEDKAAFQDFLRHEFHLASSPEFGIYLPAYKLFATYGDSGLGTFTHEIMHPLVERNLKDRPLWAIEGIPTFFEKFYGYWEDEELVVHWGYQNPWRIRALGTNLTRLDLNGILSTKNPQGQFRESDVRLVSMFLWEHGKFQRFLDLIQKREKNGYNSYFEAALEMPIESVLPLWQKYLDDVEAARDKILQLPLSTVLDSESDFKSFAKSYGLLPNPDERGVVPAKPQTTGMPIAVSQAPRPPQKFQTIKLKDGRTIIGEIKMQIGLIVYIVTKDGKQLEINSREIVPGP